MNKRRFISTILVFSLLFSCKKNEESSLDSFISSIIEDSSISSIDPSINLKQYDYSNLDYSTNKIIKNLYKNALSVPINDNEDYTSLNNDCSYKEKFLENDNKVNLDEFNYYDLSIPNNINKNNIKDKYNIILFLHPSGWISGSKDDLKYEDLSLTSLLSGNYVIPDNLKLFEDTIKDSIQNRYITISMNYTLMVQETGHKELSVYRMLDEIDACLNHALNLLISLGFKKDNLSLILSGASAGSYLAMLYAYSRNEQITLKPRAIVNIVGPVSFNYLAWRQFIDSNKRKYGSSILPENIKLDETEPLDLENTGFKYISKFTQFETMRFTNGLAGSIYNEDELSILKNEDDTVKINDKSNLLLNEIENSLSPINYINSSSTPTFSLYGGRDQIIGINQYATLKPVLDRYNVKNQLHYEKNFTHYLGTDDVNDLSDFLSLIKIYQKITREIRQFFKELNLI